MNTAREKRKETNRLGLKCVWEIIELNYTPLILTVSWVLTCAVAASTPILSSVTLCVFVAMTDSPGVTLRLQCTIRHLCSSPQWLTVRETAQSNNPSQTQHVWLPGDPPCGVYSLSIGPELRNSANGHMILLSLWMLIITVQLLHCYLCH